MRDEIIKIAKENSCDIIGFASKNRFSENDPIFKIFPETKTVICLVFRTLRGSYRGIEEGTTYYQYTTMSVENMEETVMPKASLAVANFIEANGYIAIPQRRNQTILKDENETNPEADYYAIYYTDVENQMNFIETAAKCGVGEISLHKTLLTDEFGPFNRYCFVLTDAEIEESEEFKPHLCDKCEKCIKGCPGNAISKDGNTDSWRCAVYYKGGSGLKNPFMPPDAFMNFEDRLEIIAGEAEISKEKAKKIIDNIYFYPPAMHSYDCSICGRACDIECYVHLEEKGVLTKKFKEKFRKREPWKFKIEDFK